MAVPLSKQEDDIKNLNSRSENERESISKILGGLLKFFSPSQQYYYSIDLEICQEFFSQLKKFFLSCRLV